MKTPGGAPVICVALLAMWVGAAAGKQRPRETEAAAQWQGDQEDTHDNDRVRTRPLDKTKSTGGHSRGRCSGYGSAPLSVRRGPELSERVSKTLWRRPRVASQRTRLLWLPIVSGLVWLPIAPVSSR
jgi:hypothetical protein